MKKKLFLSFLTILSLLSSYAQTQYLLFDEPFNDNRNHWLIGNRAKTNAYIQQGVFYFESKSPSANYSRRIECGYLRDQQDFEIEIRIRQLEGSQNRGYGLEWGGNSNDNSLHEFWIRNDGYYSIDEFDGRNGSMIDHVPYRYSDHIRISEFNTLTVRKEGSRVACFINGAKVNEINFTKFYGSEVGFIVPPRAAVEVDYIKVSLIDQKPKPVLKQDNFQIYAVVVGVADYLHDGPELEDLNFTVRDAVAMANFYKSPNGGGLPDENIVVLLDEDASAKNIMNATENIFARSNKGDMIIFYFAGHGVLLPVNGELSLHLAPYDFKPGVVSSGISAISIEEKFNAANAGKKLWIIDACHSGGTLTKQKGRIKDRIKNLDDKDIALITSSDLGETSLEISGGIDRGLFSFFLTDALVTNSKEADKNQDFIISILELFEYTRDKTQHKAMTDYNHKQTPQLGGKFNVQLPIGEVVLK